MNTTEKFQKLVKIASENGWCNWLPETYKVYADNCSMYFEKRCDCLNSCKVLQHEMSFNDIILNCKDNETSFIEALCKANQKAVSQHQGFILGDKQLPYVYLTILWEYDITTKKLRPTSQRLDWLFDTFKHLL
jgi:hypothetical protein